MSKPIRLSHSAVQIFNACSKKYEYHYLQRLRPVKQNSALIFGSAMDLALNDLLINKNLEMAVATFDHNMRIAKVNDQEIFVPTSDLIKYSKADLDEELLFESDQHQSFNNLGIPLPPFNKSWLSLRQKGFILIKAYHDEVLPKIKEVICSQKQIDLQNEDGDTVIGFLDLAVVWEDGKRYILDNKTASRRYEENAVAESQQLSLYFHAEQEEMKLDGAGFIVMLKEINKNRKKICEVCAFDGSGTRYKSCPNEVNGNRCDGTWIESINPTGTIQILLGQVSPQMEDTVINTFDDACTGIKSGVFEKNFDSCFQYGRCPYYLYCHDNDGSDLVQLPEKEVK